MQQERPVNTMLSKSTSKRPLQDTNDDNSRPQATRNPPAYQSQEAKRMRMSEEFDDDIETADTQRPLKASAIRPPSIYKTVRTPNILSFSYILIESHRTCQQSSRYSLLDTAKLPLRALDPRTFSGPQSPSSTPSATRNPPTQWIWLRFPRVTSLACLIKRQCGHQAPSSLRPSLPPAPLHGTRTERPSICLISRQMTMMRTKMSICPWRLGLIPQR